MKNNTILIQETKKFVGYHDRCVHFTMSCSRRPPFMLISEPCMLCSKFFHPALFSKQYVVVYEFAYDCLVLTISGSKILCKSRFYCKPGAFFNAGFESAI